MTDPQDSIVRPADPIRPANMTRRKLFRGAAAGTGVLLSVQAKTALGGGVCQSPSAILSGNTSPRPGDGTTCSGGRSPGFWMQPQHWLYWTGGMTPPSVEGMVACQSGLGDLKKVEWDDIKDQGTTFESVFGHEPVRNVIGTYPGAVGLWAVMVFKTDFQGSELLFHIVAAYLNSKYFTTDPQKYPLTPQQVVDMYNAVKGGGTYCPPSLLSCGNGWTASQVIAYIQGMYDINDDVPNLCSTSPSKKQ